MLQANRSAGRATWASAIVAALGAVIMASATPALAQDATPGQASPRTAEPGQPIVHRRSGFGLGGVRSRIAPTNRINTTPPIERREGSLLPPPPPQPPRAERPRRPIIIAPRPRRPVIVFPRHDRIVGTVTSGSGLSIGGRLGGDDDFLDFHVGSRLKVIDRRCPGPAHWGFPWWGWYFDRYDYPIDGTYAAIDPALAAPSTAPSAPPAPPAPPPTALERAEMLLAAGQAEAAVRAFREHLGDNPDDAAAMRSLALALLEAGHVPEAVAVMAQAYRMDPSLAHRAVPAEAVHEGLAGLRRDVSRASIYANRVRTGSAWLMLAVLMQAEGRTSLAARMIERAAEAGLDRAIVERMRAGLGA